MPGFLGTAEHRVTFTYRGATLPLGALDTKQITSLDYTRVLDDTSTCAVEVQIPGGSSECCRVLGDLRSWGHEVHVWRDGVDVWCGPVVNVTLRRDTATILAADVTAWLDKRLVHSTLDYTATGLGAADLATIAAAVITDAFAPDDPNVLPYLTVALAGVVGERLIEAGKSRSGDELRELARTGVDYTAVGRRIVLTGEVVTTTPLATLLQDSFLASLEVVERGDLAATSWRVVGDGVTGTAAVVEPFYGLLEDIVDEQSVRDTASATAAAQTRLDASNPVPLFLVVPEDARLSPNAPVTFDQLVPGAVTRVLVSDYCRQVDQFMRLQRVRVASTPDSLDAVQITLAPLGTTTESA